MKLKELQKVFEQLKKGFSSKKKPDEHIDLIDAAYNYALKLYEEHNSTFNSYQVLPRVYKSLKEAKDEKKFYINLAEFLVLLEGIIIYESVLEKESYSIFAKICLFRHGQTEYTNVGLDLTEDGIKYLSDKKDLILEYYNPEKETMLLASSPAVRAIGSLKILFPEGERRTVEFVTHVQMKDKKAAQKWISDNIQLPNLDVKARIKKADTMFHRGEFPEEIFGKKSEMEKQFCKAFETMLRYMNRYHKNKIPYAIVVSHFEFIDHLTTLLFDTNPPNTANPGEHLEFTILKKEKLNKELVPVIIRFRNRYAKAIFDRRKRKMLKWTN